MPKPNKPTFSYPTAMVFAAAVRAFRNNNAYHKADLVEYIDTEQGTECKVTPRNMTLMRQYLTDTPEAIKEEDINQARKIIEYYQSKLLDLMSGKLNSYSQAATHIVNKETITDLQELGLIASLPKAYENSIEFDQILEAKELALAGSNYFGKVGDNWSGKVTIISSIYSQKWFRYFHVAQDIESKNVVNFSSGVSLEIGKEMIIKGRIKDHVDGKVTRLNYVKIAS